MNHKMREMVYSAVLADTMEFREKILQFWLDCGDDLSDGEHEELDSNMAKLQRYAEMSATLAAMSVEAAETKMDHIKAYDNAKKWGLIEGDEDEDEEEYDI